MADRRVVEAEIRAEARSRCGLAAPPEPDLGEGLTRLVAGINANTRMHPAGRERIREQLVVYLASRLKAEHYWNTHPEVQTQKIVEPVFVMGMPRTGTTLSVNLFDCDSEWLTLLKWQVHNLVPPPTYADRRDDPRCLAELAAERAAGGAGTNPNIHAETADSPAECVQLHMQDFHALGWDSYAGSPEYSEYLMTADMRPTYRWHRKVLQILQSRSPMRRWMLKAPSHSMFADALLAVYPDARLIWTHRDPVVATASLLSLVTNVHLRYTDDPDLAWLARFLPRQLLAHVDGALRATARVPDQVHHLSYERLVRDPFAEMEAAYRWLGRPFTDATRAAVAAWLEVNPQGKFGAHTYALEQWGLEDSAIRNLFAHYRDPTAS